MGSKLSLGTILTFTLPLEFILQEWYSYVAFVEIKVIGKIFVSFKYFVTDITLDMADQGNLQK